MPFLFSLIGFYASNFIELDKLSAGGFGTVYRVRSLVDDSLYAMKKIKLDSTLKRGRFEKVRLHFVEVC